MTDVGALVAAAEAKWETSQAECVGMLRLALNGTKDAERLYVLQSLIVHNEWYARSQRGLPPYHSVDTDDLGFKFADMREYHALAEKFQTQPKIMGAYSLDDPGDDLGEWAKVHRLREPPDGPLAWLSCDGKYFKLFGAVLLKSLEGSAVHLHLMDADESVLNLIESTGIDCGLSIEKPKADKGYYHAVRFIRFAEDLERYGRQMWLLDVDAVANRSPALLPSGLSMRLRPGRLEAWNQFNACVVGGGPESLPYFRKVGAFINRNREKLHWGIDQLALYCVWKRDPIAIRCLGPKEVDYDYQPDGIIWCNSGSSKFKHIAGDKKDRPKYQERFNALKLEIGADGEGERGKRAMLAGDYAGAKKHFHRAFDMVAAESDVESLDPPPSNPVNRIGKYLYLPVEIAGRELASKAWLAGECARRGFDVLLGATWNMSDYKWRDWPPGIVLFKTMMGMDAQQFWKAKSLAGHQVAVMDEEMLPMTPEARNYQRWCCPQAMTLADLICAPGEKAAAALREFLPAKKVVVTGNPRGIKPSRRSNGNGNGNGKILVCTVFPFVNGVQSFARNVDMFFRVMMKTPEGDALEMWREQLDHELRWLPLMLQAIDALREKYGERVFVRPHPSENPDTFGLKRDDVSLADRLSEADCVVYLSSCGTGLDAAMAVVPAVRIGSGSNGISSTFGDDTETVEQVLAQVEKCLAGETAIPALDGIIAKDVTLPVELEKLWRRNAYDVDFDLATAYRKQRNVEYKPGSFERDKFPDIFDDKISDMVGLPVEKLSWNLWSIRAVSSRRSAASAAE